MKKKEPGEKTAVAKLREKFFEIKNSIRPSEELKEILKKKSEKKVDSDEDANKKVAHTRTPKNEAGI